MQHTMKTILLALCLGLATLISACGSSNPILGSWEFDRITTAGDDPMVKGAVNVMGSMMEGMKFIFTDDQLTTSAAGQSQSQPIEEYTIDGNTVTVWVKAENGQKEGQEFNVSEDGESMTMHVSNGFVDMTANYVRSKS